MDILYTIEKENAKNRRLMVIIVTLVVILACVIISVCVYSTIKSKDKIYALDNESNVIVFNQVKEDRKTEAEGHFKAFHRLFFNLPPDGKVIERNITKLAFELIDKTGKVYYDKLMQDRFFHNLVVMNITQELQIDSIKVSSRHPFQVMLWGKIYLIGQQVIKEKSLVTSGIMRNINHRSESNPHGFIIEKFQILENKDLKEYERR